MRDAPPPNDRPLIGVDLDTAIREACLPNMRKQLAGEPVTSDDIDSEQAALDRIRVSFDG